MDYYIERAFIGEHEFSSYLEFGGEVDVLIVRSVQDPSYYMYADHFLDVNKVVKFTVTETEEI